MKENLNYLLKLIGVLLILTILTSLIIVVFGLIMKWNNPTQFSNGFFTAGAILIVLGFLSVSGGFAQRANFNMTYAESAGQANIAERTQRMMGDITQRYGTMTLFGVVGLLLIVIAVLIGNFFIT